MSAPPNALTRSELARLDVASRSPEDDDLALEVLDARWVLEHVRDRGVPLMAARCEPDGSWVPCAPEDLYATADLASIGQRPGCGGVVTTLHVWDAAGLHGAWWLDRAAGGDDLFLRVLLLQALLRAERRASAW